MTPARLAAAAILLALAAAGQAVIAGNTGNFQVEVADARGKAIEGAKLIVTDPVSAAVKLEASCDRGGRASLSGLLPRAYNFRVEKDGYQTYESNFLAHAGETERKKVTLRLIGDATPGSGAGDLSGASVKTKTDLWAVAYNEAVPLYSGNKVDEAMAKLDAALQLKPDFAPALMLKGAIEEERGKCDEAVPLLKRAFALDSGLKDSLGPLIRCLEKGGMKDEAASYRSLLSQAGRSKSDLYNEAVSEINKGDDTAAAPLLEQALQQDEKFAPALYQYGLVLFRRGDIAGASARLESYVKLAPGGEFADDARNLLKALAP